MRGTAQERSSLLEKMERPNALPFSFDSITTEFGRRPIGFRFANHSINIKACLSGNEIVATGEDSSYDVAEAKAFSELIERSALLSLGQKYGAKSSNGWAAHPHKSQAETNAIHELVERDAVLSQWYSSTPFLEIDPRSFPYAIQKWATDELARSEFPRLVLLLSTKGLGPSVTSLLLNKNGFGVCAHAARESLGAAVNAAITEVCRAAHGAIRHEYWRDTLKLKSGSRDPIGPNAHALYYAYHVSFPEWIFGEKIDWEKADTLWQQRMAIVNAADNQFELQTVMEFPVHVSFAKHPEAFELQWGSTDVECVARCKGAKRLGLNSKVINKETHIVS